MRILSIDGGGIRGLIPAIVLGEVERRTQKPIHELFDLIAGTSTGGILACALTRPSPLRAEELSALYETEGPRIFSRSLGRRFTSADGLLEERYDDEGLDEALERYLGAARLREALTPVLITAYDIERRAAFFFRSERARRDPAYDFSMAQAARATSAAPTYFEPVQLGAAAGAERYALVDGGVFAPNPAMCAYAEAIAEGEVELVASLGTGQLTRPIPYEDARGWGQLGWVRPLIDTVFDGVADTVDFQLGRLLGPRGYVRLQTELRTASDDLDDASEANLGRLREEAERLVRARDSELDALCARLA